MELDVKGQGALVQSVCNELVINYRRLYNLCYYSFFDEGQHGFTLLIRGRQPPCKPVSSSCLAPNVIRMQSGIDPALAGSHCKYEAKTEEM